MVATPFFSLLTIALFYPAPRPPEPDDKGRGFFGVHLVDNGGVVVMGVEKGSPAERGGFQINDIIQTIDMIPATSVDDAKELIGRLRPGTITVAEVRRGTAIVTVKVKVGVRPDSLP